MRHGIKLMAAWMIILALLSACQRGLTRQLKETAYVMDARFSSGGDQIITAGLEGTATIWEMSSGKKLTELTGPYLELRTAMFSQDGSLAVTIGRTDTLSNLTQVWDARNGEKLFQLTGLADQISSGEISADNRWLLTLSPGEGYGLLWDLADVEAYHRLERPPIALTTSGRSDYGESVIPPTWLFPKDQPPAYEIRIHAELISGGTCSYSNGQSFTAHNWLVDAEIIDLTTSIPVAHKTFDQGSTCLGIIIQGQAGAVLVGETTTTQVRRWLKEVMGPLGYQSPTVVNFKADPDEVGFQYPHRISLSPDGSQMIITTKPADEWTRIFDSKTGQFLRALQHSGVWVTNAIFSPNGRFILTTDSLAQAHLWDASTGELLRTIQLVDNPDSVEVNFEGLSFIQGTIETVAISPDGTLLATADGLEQNCDYKCVIHLWDLQSGKLLTELPGHDDLIEALHFSRDGQWLLSASDDKTARIWNVSSVINK